MGGSGGEGVVLSVVGVFLVFDLHFLVELVLVSGVVVEGVLDEGA